MREQYNVFHLAIPCRDIEQTIHFYVSLLGCKLARRYDDRATFDFFGDQLVCHLDPESTAVEPVLYPRHFGVTFRHREAFDNLLTLVRTRDVPLLREPSTRFAGTAEAHETFFLSDPANNVLEFKHYRDPRMMY